MGLRGPRHEAGRNLRSQGLLHGRTAAWFSDDYRIVAAETARPHLELRLVRFPRPLLLHRRRQSKDDPLGRYEHSGCADQAAKQAEADGCRAICGDCGYFGNFQAPIAEQSTSPPMSSVVQVPWVRAGLRSDQKVGLICADRPNLTVNTFLSCGMTERITTAASSTEEMNTPSSTDCGFAGPLRLRRAEQEILNIAKKMMYSHPKSVQSSSSARISPVFARRHGRPEHSGVRRHHIPAVRARCRVQMPYYGFYRRRTACLRPTTFPVASLISEENDSSGRRSTASVTSSVEACRRIRRAVGSFVEYGFDGLTMRIPTAGNPDGPASAPPTRWRPSGWPVPSQRYPALIRAQARTWTDTAFPIQISPCGKPHASGNRCAEVRQDISEQIGAHDDTEALARAP